MILADNIRIIDLTVGQLKALIQEQIPKQEPQQDEYAYGIDGLAKALGCCRSQAKYIKKTGRYKAAIQQDGRKIVVNVTKLRKLIPHA